LVMVTRCLMEVQKSKKFIRLLEVVLKIGNVLNGGSPKGGAYGFKIESLTKLVDVRTNNPEIPTLLHYLASKAESEFPDLLEISAEMPSLPDACKESLQQLQQDLAALKKGVDIVVNTVKTTTDATGSFLEKMKPFAERAARGITTLEGKHAKCEACAKEVIAFFSEPAGTPPESFLANVFNVVQAINHAVDDLQKRRAAAQKAKEAEEKRSKLRKEKAAGSGAGGEPKGALDRVIGQMQTGDAFVRGPDQSGKEGHQMMANEALAIFAKMKQKRDGN